MIKKQSKRADDARNCGRSQEAIALYRKLFMYFDQIGDVEQAGQQLQMIGVCYKIENSTAQALAELKEAISYFRSHGLERDVGNTLRDIGITYEYANRLEEAERFLRESQLLLERVDDRDGLGITLAKLGLVQVRKRKFPEAKQLLLKALEFLQPTTSHDDVHWFYRATTLGHIGTLAVEQQQFNDALAWFRQAQIILQTHPYDLHTRRQAQYAGLMAHCYTMLSKSNEAIVQLKCSFDLLFDGTFSPSALAVVLRDIKASETLDRLQRQF